MLHPNQGSSILSPALKRPHGLAWVGWAWASLVGGAGLLSASPYCRPGGAGSLNHGSEVKARAGAPAESVASSLCPSAAHHDRPENRPHFWLPKQGQGDFAMDISLGTTLRCLNRSFSVGFPLSAEAPEMEKAVQAVLQQQNALLEKLDQMGFERSRWVLLPVERFNLPQRRPLPMPLPTPAPQPVSEPQAGDSNEAAVTPPFAKGIGVEPAMLTKPAPLERCVARGCVWGALDQIDRLPELFEWAQRAGTPFQLQESSMGSTEALGPVARKEAWHRAQLELGELLQSMGLELKSWEEIQFESPIKLQAPQPWGSILESFKGRFRVPAPVGSPVGLLSPLNPEMLERMCSIYQVPVKARIKVGLPTPLSTEYLTEESDEGEDGLSF